MISIAVACSVVYVVNLVLAFVPPREVGAIFGWSCALCWSVSFAAGWLP